MCDKILLKRFLWVILVLLILPTTAGCQDLEPAIKAYEKGDYNQAIQLLSQYILQKPNEPEAYFYLGNAFLKKEMLDSAIVQYKKALDLKSKYWQALYQLGYAYYKQKRYDEAKETFASGLKIKERGEFYNGLGLVQMAKDMLKDADLSFWKAISYDPKNPEFLKNRGDVNFKKGVLAIAIESYNDALALDSTLVDVHYNLGQSYLKQMEFNKAMEEFKTVIRLDPKHKEAYLALGNLYMLDRRHYPEARVIYEEYLKFDQQNSRVHLNLGDTYYSLSRIVNFLPLAEGDTLFKPQILSKSVENLEKSIALDPKVADAYFLLGKAYQDLGKFPEALKAYENYERLLSEQNYEWKKEDADYWVRKGQAQVEIGDSALIPTAITSLTRAIELDSTKTGAYSYLGSALYKQKKYTEAIPFFKKKIESDTSNANAYMNLALCYLQLKQFQEAREPLKKVVELDPNNSKAHDLLAGVYYQLKQYQEAAEEYLAKLRLDPNNCELEGNAGTCLLLAKLSAQAIHHLRKAVSCFPRNANYLLMLAQALETNENTEEARQYYLKVLEIDPKNKEAQDRIDYIDMKTIH
ncbi:MAG: tetratricopeptide repeat protein [candidate division Zixibacteria bacterium]|nr:tetratricopeptide repeat protein [candidate division Zixibacteria bacterium]